MTCSTGNCHELFNKAGCFDVTVISLPHTCQLLAHTDNALVFSFILLYLMSSAINLFASLNSGGTTALLTRTIFSVDLYNTLFHPCYLSGHGPG
jgi:hypothetical protein